MTVKQLRDALQLIAERHDDTEVVVWLPGGRVHIDKFMGQYGDVILFEGTRGPANSGG
jgi:hypothetical protein